MITIRQWLRRLWPSKGHDASASTVEVDDSSVDPFNPFPEPVTVEITDVIDLHTIPPRDVKRVVEEYLNEAHRAGFRTVRIIHGKGVGVQRVMVRTVLARTAFVRDWTDAPPEAGGLGATIVRLAQLNSRRTSRPRN
jgi:dsDNA-specific endonuclease/ATPase MutS2